MPNCCVMQCSSRKRINQQELTFHRMPKNENLRKKWLDIIGIKNINPRQKSWFVCSLHFAESSFNRTLSVVRLHDNAVPLASHLINKNSGALNKPEFKSHEQSDLQQLQPNKSLKSTCVMLTDKQGLSDLCESTNIQQANSSTVTPPLQNVETAIKEINKNSGALNKPEFKSHEQSDLQQLQPNKSLQSTCVMLTDKQGLSDLCESTNIQQANSSTVTPPLQNVETAIKEMQNKEKIKKLFLTCNHQRKTIKRLNEKLKNRDKKIALLKNIIEDLKKTL